MPDLKRIIGDDGKLMRGVLGAEVIGDAILTIAANTWVLITAKAVVSSAFGGLSVGEFYISPVTETPVAGDNWKVLTTTDMVDLAGWSLELMADEVDVTVLKDVFKKYRKGKKDASGTASFIYIKGVTDVDGNLANYFFKKANISAGGVATVNSIIGDPLYLVGYVDQANGGTDTQTVATILQVEFFNFSLPMNMSEAVKMDVPFRLVGDVDPILYVITNP